MSVTSIIGLSVISICIHHMVNGRPVTGGVDVTKCDGILYPSEPVYLNDNHCYMFDTDRMYWDDSQKACKSRGGNLVSIPDTATQHFINRTALILGWDKLHVWIGATDSQTEGRWLWVNGQDLSYMNWALGSPHIMPRRQKRFFLGSRDTHPDHTATNSDCAYMSLSDGGVWRDSPCHRDGIQYPFICQFNLRRPTTITITQKTTPVTSLPTTTVSKTTENSVTITTNDLGRNLTTDEIDELSLDGFSNLTLITNSSQPVPDDIDNKHTDPDHLTLDKHSKIGLVAGLSVGGGIIALSIIAGLLIVHRIRTSQKVHLADVVAFDNSSYITPSGELPVNPSYFSEHGAEDGDTHIYQLPEDTPDSKSDNLDLINV